MSLFLLGAGQGLQIMGLAALLIRLSLWLGLLSHRRRLSSDNCEATALPIEARALLCMQTTSCSQCRMG